MFCTGGNLNQINVMYTRYFSQFQYCLPIGVQDKNHKTSSSVSLSSVRVHIGGKTEQICGHVIGQETRIKDIKELDSPVTLVKSSLISLRPELGLHKINRKLRSRLTIVVRDAWEIFKSQPCRHGISIKSFKIYTCTSAQILSPHILEVYKYTYIFSRRHKEYMG